MEYLPNGFVLETVPGAFPLSTDSMALAHFANLPKNSRVLDLGSGCGTLGLLLCASDPLCHVTGIELEEKAHLAAMENIRRNQLEDRLHSICADLRSMPAEIAAGSFQICVSNPPYFSAGAVSRSTPLARHDSCCSAQELFDAAAHALKFGGDFFLVHKPDQLAHLCACASNVKLEPKRLCLVRHSPDKEISLILLQCRKGGKPGLKLEELCLFDVDRHPTGAYRKIYHL